MDAQQRIKEVEALLPNYEPKQTDINEVKRLRTKYKDKLKGYDYVEDITNLSIGDYIQFYYSDFNTLSAKFKITKINMSKYGIISTFTVQNNLLRTKSKNINPYKYIIFKKQRDAKVTGIDRQKLMALLNLTPADFVD